MIVHMIFPAAAGTGDSMCNRHALNAARSPGGMPAHNRYRLRRDAAERATRRGQFPIDASHPH
jgi:hypothetical protein